MDKNSGFWINPRSATQHMMTGVRTGGKYTNGREGKPEHRLKLTGCVEANNSFIEAINSFFTDQAIKPSFWSGSISNPDSATPFCDP
jgi:hypothetical protein